MSVALLLFGISWMKNPNLFAVFKSSNNNAAAASSDAAKYYAYVTPAEDMQPMVLGASTQPQGPMIINDDGSVQPVDMGQVLGASTQDVQLSLDDIKVNAVADSSAAIKKYFADAQTAENGAIDQVSFAAALNSADQSQLDAQAQKLILINNALQKVSVPQSLVKLEKLKIVQYNSEISLLQNFTKADQNTEQTTQALQQFMKSQDDIDAENAALAQKFPNDDPYAEIYAGSPASNQSTATEPGDQSNQTINTTSLGTSNEAQ
jgi:hypothetical protein